MAMGESAAIIRQVRRLFVEGTLAGFTDGQLLERFLARRDEEAFAALLARHGPMVLAVCRQILGDRHDVEDAFQATFLLLVRKAGAVRDRERFGGWLYRVSYRVATRARSGASRRRKHELRRAISRTATSASEASPGDLGAAIHEEVQRLPEKYREPIVLCYLEGRTHDEAACQLRWPVGTVRGRLSRGRGLLRDRLARRGLALSAASLAEALPRAAAEVAAPLLRSTVEAARRIATGKAATAGAVSASVAALMKGEANAMASSTLKTAATILVAVAMAGAGGGLMARGWAGVPPRDGRGDDREAPGDRGLAPAAGEAESADHPPDRGPKVDADLARAVEGRVVKALPVEKDCMILLYLPQWSHGDVDNLGLANNDGGVRTLLDWADVPAEEAAPPDRRFLLALYSRKTTANGPVGPIQAHEIQADWPERTSWRTQPAADARPGATSEFLPGDGWKLFDVTALVRARAVAEGRGRGVLLRFSDEGRMGDDWSGFAFVSREGTGEFATRRPVLLVVDPAK